MAGETVLNGRYQLVAQQGSGGMSVIYKAVDRALGRTVAIKILRPSLTSDPSFLEKFRNEARAVANLSHPNIVTVYDVGSDAPTYYIVMELVEGTDLKKIVKANGALPIDRAIELSIQICAGLGYAHRSGLVHADVKPQNILVTPQDIVKVTDFGIAQALTNTQPQRKVDVVWGSPHYFAPEQARGEAPSPQSDVYSVGIVMFELLTGDLPYVGTNQQELAMAHIREPIPNVTDLNPKVPDGLSKMIARAMAKDPRDRFRDADQLGNVLTKFRDNARNLTAITPQVSPQPPSPPPSRPQSNTEDVTAKYSSAPDAPQYYDPRQANPQPNNPSVARPAQPFEQRYTTPPPPQNAQTAPQQPYYPDQQGYPAPQPQYNPALNESGNYPPQNFSQPMPTVEDAGMDYVTIALGLIAVMAVGGLIVLWAVVISSIG